MTVTMNQPEQVDYFTWRISWSSDLGGTPTFYIYVDGSLLYTIAATQIDIHVEPGDNVIVEVFDVLGAVPSVIWPGHLTIDWRTQAGTEYYRIDELVSAVWTQRARVNHDSREAYQRWATRFLEDETSHQFRVVAVGENGNEAAAASLTCLMVRNPDEPDADYAYDGSVAGTVTITEA